MTPNEWIPIRHFRPSEFDFPDKLENDLIVRLDNARRIARVPFIITSDWRDDADSEHGFGWGIDFKDNREGKPVHSLWRWHAVHGLEEAGFTRIGQYDKHLHAGIGDRLGDFPGPRMWWGEST